MSLAHADSHQNHPAGDNIQVNNATYQKTQTDRHRQSSDKPSNQRIVLAGSDLSFRNFDHRNLAYADLRGANLSGSSFVGCDLRYALLDGADLSDTNLTNSKLTGTSFGGHCNIQGIYGAPLFQITGVGKHRRTLTLLASGKHSNWVWFADCFHGTTKLLRRAVLQKYGEAGGGYFEAMHALEALAKCSKAF